MFDLVSMAGLAVSSTVVVIFLSSALSRTLRGRSWVATAFVGWFSLVLAAGATGAFANKGAIGVAGLGLAVVIPVAVLSLLVLGTARGRALVAGSSLGALVGVQVMRALGITFVLLYWAKRLPAPFAPVAGWGDVTVGLLAIPLALLLARRPDAVAKTPVLLWNVLGLMDLVIAVALGTTSSPGPLQIFHGEPNSGMMSTLPLILIPCFLVPLFAFIHLCTFYRLRGWVSGERSETLRSVPVAARAV